MTQSSTSFDVCIRGAGIVGRSLALLLAAQQLRVALVHKTGADKSNTGHSDVRAYSLNLASKQLLTDLRCWPDSPASTPILQMQIQGDQGGELRFDAAQQGVEALNWMVDVPVLEEKLAQAVRFQTYIEEMSEPVAAPLTVICEGRASQTRAELGVDFEVKHYAQHALACRIKTAAPHHQVAKQWFQNIQGPEILAFLPIGGEHSHEWAIVWSLPPECAQVLLKTDDLLLTSPIHIEDMGGISVTQLRAKATILKQKYGIKVIFIDYLQLMSGTGKSNQNREQEVSYISRSLKALAKELEVPIIALSQLSRRVEERVDKMPQLSDLRESGSIEQDADAVIMLMRPAYYEMTEPIEIGGKEYATNDLVICKVEKNRHGSTKNIALKFLPETMKFEDYNI